MFIPPAALLPLRPYIGIDPGTTGAIAVVHGRSVEVYDVPHTTKRVRGYDRTSIDMRATLDLVCRHAGSTWTAAWPALAEGGAIENVGGVGGQGAGGSFTFGRAAGALEMALYAAGVEPARVAPQSWKGYFRLIGKPKAASRALASELYPSAAGSFAEAGDHDRAEAALIAVYGAVALNK